MLARTCYPHFFARASLFRLAFYVDSNDTKRMRPQGLVNESIEASNIMLPSAALLEAYRLRHKTFCTNAFSTYRTNQHKKTTISKSRIQGVQLATIFLTLSPASPSLRRLELAPTHACCCLAAAGRDARARKKRKAVRASIERAQRRPMRLHSSYLLLF